jgi:hypothetical protein
MKKHAPKDKGRAEATGWQPDVQVVALDKLSGSRGGDAAETEGWDPHMKACMEY